MSVVVDGDGSRWLPMTCAMTGQPIMVHRPAHVAPTALRDPSPCDDFGWDENRAERREGLRGRLSLPMPWHGAVPRVGGSTSTLRILPGGRVELRKSEFRDRRPAIRLDVVPVIHQRAAHSRQSARWATTTVRDIDSHHTFGPVTVLGADHTDQDAESTSGPAARADHTDTGPPEDAPQPATRDAASTATPPPGPNPPTGALAGGCAHGRVPT
jgi:hypothetical protein